MKQRRYKRAPKFYFFDPGVVRVLAGRVNYDLVPKSFEYGQLFENFIVNEIHRRLVYSEQQFSLSFIRITEDIEIDLVIERALRPTVLV